MALATSNLYMSSVLSTLGVASLKAIFYNGTTLKTISEFGALVNKDGLSATFNPESTPDLRLAALLSTRSMNRFKGYTHNVVVDYLNVVPSTETVLDTSTSTSFAIQSNRSWTVTDNQAWLTLNKASGTGNDVIILTYSANTGVQRTATVTVTAGAIVKTFVLTQQAYTNILELSIDQVTFNLFGDIPEIVVVTSNVSWTVSDDQTWIICSPPIGSGNGSFNITCADNLPGEVRFGLVTVTGGGISRYIIVTQEG